MAILVVLDKPLVKARRARRRRITLQVAPAAAPDEPPAFRFRDTWQRVETLDANRREEARRQRAARIAIKPVSTIALMADDANSKVRRVRVLDPVERAFRNDDISEEHYRLARCLEQDLLALLPPSGGLKLERLREGGRCWRARDARDGEAFVLMPKAPGISTRAPQARRDDALFNLQRAADAIAADPVTGAKHAGPAYAVLRAWAGEGVALYELDARWRRRRGWALSMVQFALGRMADAQVYEREKWRIDVLAAA